MDYSYPLRPDWSTEEIIDAVAFFQAVEKAYESTIKREEFMSAYRLFKTIVPSMAEEKTLFKEFEEVSGLNSYQVVKKAKAGIDGELLDMSR
ncbi:MULTISPECIES: UPF0223 family protein [Sporosarcina]|uniref:UPF0223 protein ACFQ38_17255 n=1 Tax=Sporosarcina contaminans TaxID=633403 RepID=A0ABW3U5H9_9BACL